MITCMLLMLIVAGLIVWALQAGGRLGSSSRQRVRPQNRQVTRPPGKKVARRRPAKPPVVQHQPAGNRASGLSEAQIQAILKRALGAVWEAEQERLRAQVVQQERKIAAKLRAGQQALDFAEMRSLHEKSRQTADLAYASLDGARATENAISENIRNTHRAIEAERDRGGRNVTTMRQALDALHVDRDVIRTYRNRYEQDVQRLNRETARLRDAIGQNCGPQGRRWHQALMERTKARKEGRRA